MSEKKASREQRPLSQIKVWAIDISVVFYAFPRFVVESDCQKALYHVSAEPLNLNDIHLTLVVRL